jgi:hypothetical protein
MPRPYPYRTVWLRPCASLESQSVKSTRGARLSATVGSSRLRRISDGDGFLPSRCLALLGVGVGIGIGIETTSDAGTDPGSPWRPRTMPASGERLHH